VLLIINSLMPWRRSEQTRRTRAHTHAHTHIHTCTACAPGQRTWRLHVRTCITCTHRYAHAHTRTHACTRARTWLLASRSAAAATSDTPPPASMPASAATACGIRTSSGSATSSPSSGRLPAGHGVWAAAAHDLCFKEMCASAALRRSIPQWRGNTCVVCGMVCDGVCVSCVCGVHTTWCGVQWCV